MPYHFIERLLSPAAPIEAAASDFDAIASARLTTTQALAIEDKYSLILQNYFEFEQQLHRLSLAYLLFRDSRWTDFVDDIRDVNRVLMNLLGAQRMYVDQIPQHLNKVFAPSESQSRTFVAATRTEFDGSPGYRILYALRNHAQHGEFPVQSLSLDSKRLEEGQLKHYSHTATAFAHRDDLVQNKGLNAKVRAEVSAMPEKIDLSPLVRENMSSFARLHLVVREELRPRLNESDSALRTAYARFEEHAGRKPIGLYIVQSGDDGAEIDSHSIFLEGIERRVRFEQESATITNMEQHYVSGRKA
jgi:hypothetical protein